MLKKFVHLLPCLFWLLAVNAQPHASFEHYSVKEGLSQSIINDITQDSKGFIWLATFEGLIRFDGYSFQKFKVGTNDINIAKSSRIDRISIDKYDRLWLQSQDEAYCFIPGLQEFKGLGTDSAIMAIKQYPLYVHLQPSGKVWIASKGGGFLCIEDSLFTTTVYNTSNQQLKSDLAYSVLEDKNQNTWLMTDNGLALVPKGSNRTKAFMLNTQSLVEQAHKPILSAFETNGEIWFGSKNGLIYRYSKASKTFFEFKMNTKSNIRGCFELDAQTVFILTSDDGFITYNHNTNQLKSFNTSNLKNLQHNKIGYFSIPEPGQLWFSLRDTGIYQFNLNTENLRYYTVPVDDKTTNRISYSPFVEKDLAGNLWVHPRGGGFSFYDKETDRLMPFHNDPNDRDRRFSNIVQSAYIDRQGILWFCPRSKGLEKITFSKDYFKAVQVNSAATGLLSNHTRAIFQDSNNRIWLATKEGQVAILDENFNPLAKLTPTGNSQDGTIWPFSIYCIEQDAEGNIWLGSKGGGVYKLSPKAHGLPFTVQQFTHKATDEYSLSNNDVYAIFKDNGDRIWIGTLGGGLNLVEKWDNGTHRFMNYNNLMPQLPNNRCARIRSIAQGPMGLLHAGTSGGLISWRPNAAITKDMRIHLNSHDKPHHNTLSNNEVTSISTANNEMYVATFGGGLNKVTAWDAEGNPTGFKTYGPAAGLQAELLVATCNDGHGNIWLTSENSLVRFDTQTESFETHQEVHQLFAGSTFSEADACRLKSGQLVFGCSDGAVVFKPSDISRNAFTPSLSLLNFKVFNRPLLNHKGQPYNGSIDDTKAIELEHNQNFFTIEFTTLDFTNPQKIQYAYMLEGFDKEWNYTLAQRTANYTNIPKGKYEFRVKSTNSNGVWMANEKTLSIVVHPSFWQSPLAYLLYLLLLASLFFIIQKNILIIYKLKSDVKLQKDISDMKLKFFTDISHEIRTPLTMITAPIEYLLNDNRTPNEIKKQLSFISQSANRLLKLVNQILDFRKIQGQQLRVKETNLGRFTQKICLDFMDVAEEKSINFEFDQLPEDAHIWADPDGLEKILMNFLSNAFKYNKAGNTVRMEIASADKHITLKVHDNGPGIPKAKQKELFTRFATFNDDKSQPSTGIGLSIVKEIAEKHSAQVAVESEPGQGSTFSVAFLKGHLHFKPETKVAPLADANTQPKAENQEYTPTAPVNLLSQNDRPTILVVEDDSDLRSFIKSFLEEEYTVLEAENGAIGLQKATENCPDFIVSDIMMPKMNGIELLKHLRNQTATSHIPIILLTAKTDIDSKLDGLSYGADDYITKPFSVAYFKARVVNLIQQRKRLHAIFSSASTANANERTLKPSLITTLDEELMQKVIGCINDNLDRNDFTVEELGKLVGLARSTFFNKIKALTGMSPVEFIRDFRLQHAANLILTQNYLIKEVCYMSGFSDTKYFGKCFKAKYGATPIDYRNQHLTA